MFAAFECQRLRLSQDQHVPEWIYKSRIAAKLAEEFVVLLGIRRDQACQSKAHAVPLRPGASVSRKGATGGMSSLGEIDGYERRLRVAIVALNKRKVAGATLVEAIDEAELWPDAFDDQQPFLGGQSVAAILERAPLFVCAIAAEIGFRFEGVGTEYWNKLATALGSPITIAERTKIGDAFAALAGKYALSRPTESAFSEHFSIISWPIANALLPIDLLGPVTRLLARAPAVALPGPGRSANFSSLRAWASAAEGARLVDWLRFESASERVLAALLTENRGGGISAVSYQRLHDAVTRSAEAFFAARAARQRARRTKATAVAQECLGRLTLARNQADAQLFVTWPALAGDLADEAKIAARAAGWRPQLWSTGARLHSDTALGDGPFLLTHTEVPRADQPAYDGAAAVFGEGSLIAATLAGRSVDWSETLLFDLNEDRTRGEQRFGPFDATVGPVWIASSAAITVVDRLRPLGTVAGYRIFEADLASDADRAILAKEGLIATQDRLLAARHPVDAITAPLGVVRPGRPVVAFRLGPPIEIEAAQRFRAGERSGYSGGGSGQPRLQCEPVPDTPLVPLTLSLLERGSAFSALIERRLQLRVESSHALRAVPITAELEIDGKLLLRSTTQIEEVPCTLDKNSALLQSLYADACRNGLLERGSAILRFSVGRLVSIEVLLQRPRGTVDWSTNPPTLSDAERVELVAAPANAPHRFAPVTHMVTPKRGALGYAVRLTDGRMADPMRLLSASNFNLGDFAAQFRNDLGSRQMRDNGRGSGELARGRIAWARAECGSLQALAAKSRVVRQFEEPLVHNLCGREWCDREHADRAARSDPHEALYLVALEQGLASLPEGTSDRFATDFAEAFAVHARRLDPDWPLGRPTPLDGAMDDALNAGFTDAVSKLQTRGELAGVDPDDCDFGSVEEAWASAGEEALGRIRRSNLAALIAPSSGSQQLRDRFYTHSSIPEMAEDLAAWTRTYGLPRGQLTAEAAAGALQLWLSPAACDALDSAMRVLVNDPFVARATRYAAVRMNTTLGGAVS